MVERALPRTTEAPTATLGDAELVRRIRAGEPALFELLIRRHNPRVYRAIRAILRDEDEVEDAMQQAYLHAFAALDGFAGTAAFSTWLTRIAVNEALGRLRGRGRTVALDDGDGETEPVASADAPPAETPEDAAAAREAMGFVQRAVDRLPLPYRTVFVLREIEQLSSVDTAEALGISEDLVKVRLHRARRALRELLAAAAGRVWTDAFPFLAPRCDRIVARVMPIVLAGSP